MEKKTDSKIHYDEANVYQYKCRDYKEFKAVDKLILKQEHVLVNEINDCIDGFRSGLSDLSYEETVDLHARLKKHGICYVLLYEFLREKTRKREIKDGSI